MMKRLKLPALAVIFILIAVAARAAAPVAEAEIPLPLSHYADAPGASVLEVLIGRAKAQPFNVVATLIFLLAVVHTFLTARFRHWAHEVEAKHHKKLRAQKGKFTDNNEDGWPDEVSFKGQILHFLGEVEAVFGLWVIAIIAAITWFKGWDAAVIYVGEKVHYTEPMFVVIIMAIASTRPVLRFA
ncbi:MAG: hypothetical protein KBF26_13230, partial [Opitutaceae bacterium]|nr:hypothetical protein [Opitutaceae bacterium]